MQLRRGRTKNTLEGSLNAALLAVEVYNKPRAAFRSEAYIALMIIAWTRLFHAYFNHTIGNKYYYKKDNGRYVKVDGERKSWSLKTCISKYGKLSPTVRANLEFFIGLRNKIEHRHVKRREVDTLVFGECQALLYNYESTVVDIFGDQYALNESLAFSLQFSQMRSEEQKKANKNVLSKDLKVLHDYVDKYRTALPDEVFDSQEYSIKLIQVPKVSNTNRNDLAVEFVRWSSLSDDDKENYQRLVTIIKDKVVKQEAANVGKLKPSEVIERVNDACGTELNHYDHMCLYYVFSVRPIGEEDLDPFETDTDFCHYDEPHDDYVYQESWVNFIIDIYSNDKLDHTEVRDCFKRRDRLSVEVYV